jgi:hypothetical protein
MKSYKPGCNPYKPYIARDTGEPLVVFGGYEVNELGGLVPRPLPAKITLPLAKPEDLDLLEEQGYKSLKEQQMYGVLDRLNNTEEAIIKKMGYLDWTGLLRSEQIELMRKFIEEGVE